MSRRLFPVKPRRAVFCAAFALGFCAAVAGCATDDIVVATLPGDASVDAPTDGDASLEGDAPCTTNDDCAPTAFCARTSCGDAAGECQTRPLLCDATGMPSCGCDGVTYWNDCLRQQYGVSAGHMGNCFAGAAACVDPGGADCPVAGASCAKLLQPGAMCDGDVAGACWVLPVDCPDFGPPDRWLACGDRSTCEETCRAIRSGLPHQRDVTHDCGPPR